MFLAQPTRQSAIGSWLGLSACLAACSLQMPSESDVFGAAGSEAAANGGAPGGAGTLGDSGSEESGGADSPASGRAGMNQGSSGSTGSSAERRRARAGRAAPAGSSGSTGFDPAAGLVAYFTFDEPSGAAAANSQDSTKNAKCVGTCTRPAGQLGLAFALRNNVSRPTDWIELPTGIFKGRSAVTLSVWLRDLSTTRNAAPLFHFSLGRERSDLLHSRRQDRVPRPARTWPACTAAAHSSICGARAPVLTDKAWHQMAFSWSSASIDLYLDGKPVGSATRPNALPSELGATTPNYLGRLPDDTGSALFGEVDDLRVYDRVLSAAQVAQLYKVR